MIRACTDLGDGGLALAAFELAHGSGVGVQLDDATTPFLFGEDQGRYLIACGFDEGEALMIAAGEAGVPLSSVGRFGGDAVRIGAASAALADLSALFRNALPDALG